MLGGERPPTGHGSAKETLTMAEATNPLDLIVKSQRAAAGLLADAVGSIVELGKAGVTRPEELLKEVTGLAVAIGDLAGSTAKPLEIFLTSQRQLAETMATFAMLQRQLADVLDTAAANHAAIVQALEMMTNPMVGVAQRLRTEGRLDKEVEVEVDLDPDVAAEAAGATGRSSRRAKRPTGKSTGKPDGKSR